MAWPATVTCKVNGRQGLIIMTWPILKYWGLVISDLMWVDIFLEEIFLKETPIHSFGEEFYGKLFEML